MSLRRRNLGGVAAARIISMMFTSLLTVGPNSAVSRYLGESAITVLRSRYQIRRSAAGARAVRGPRRGDPFSRKAAGSYKTK
jgi:hypothetical protein